MEDKDRTKEELIEDLRKAKDELDIQTWGLTKTNEAIKVLYKELEKKNKELQELDKLKSDFINSVSHELRTPLTTIREAVSQVLDGVHGEAVAEQKEFLSICLQDVDRLKRMIDNLLDISKLEAGKTEIKRQDVDIVSLAKGVIAAFYLKIKAKNLEIKEKFFNEKAIAYADKDRIIQVFTNLLGNAVKFTDKGYIEISVADKGNSVECSVADSGCGIAEEDLPKVFNKFQQFSRTDDSRERGTGLGLSITKGIIELHQGRIWVESALNSGAKFTFTLPKQ